MDFRTAINTKESFTLTLELVPGNLVKSKSLDSTMGMVKECAADRRISAVSITDNPGGNPALLPEALGHTITEMGMDVIVHMACRDANRSGLESRAMQLMYLGIRNILALSGDYTDKGFSGLAAPVFDLDSVTLLCMLRKLNKKARSNNYPANLMTGCAVSPFKYTEEESFLQYRKLDHKIHAGASFIITQLGFDVRKFKECIEYGQGRLSCPPVLGSLYFATPGAAKVLSGMTVPGARIAPHVYEKVFSRVKTVGDSIELAGKLGAVIKGLGYQGLHIGGIHKKFSTVASVLDKVDTYSKDWKDIYKELEAGGGNVYYRMQGPQPTPGYSRSVSAAAAFTMYESIHSVLFSFTSFLAPFLKRMAAILDSAWPGRKFMYMVEEPAKKLLFDCHACGDCMLSQVGYFCPESQCPKHLRNGPCGGSTDRYCEVHNDRQCVWVKAAARYPAEKRLKGLMGTCIAPRSWKLNHTSSWLNFHLRRDHFSRRCSFDETADGRCDGK